MQSHSPFRALIVAVSVFCVSGVLAELVLRLAHAFRPSPIFFDASYDRFRGRPHSIDYAFPLNSGGFKDLEFAPKRDGIRRIAAIGDSFAFAVVPYQDAYLTLLEARLVAGGVSAEVLNLGIPAMGPREYLALLLREGLELDPDVVLLNFFVGNDFGETRPKKRSLLSYSYFATLLRYAVGLQLQFEGVIIHGRRAYRDDQPTFAPETYLQLQLERSYVFDPEDPDFDRDLSSAADFVRRISAICAERGIELWLVIIPDETQVDPDLRARVVNARPGVQLDFRRPNRALAGRLASLEIPTIDLLDDFRAAGLREPLYRPDDSHWNVAGNELAAELIADAMTEAWRGP